MLVTSLITLVLATVATFFSINTDEEVFKVAIGFAAVLSALLTLIFAPWIVKLVVIAVPLVLDKLNYWKTEDSNN